MDEKTFDSIYGEGMLARIRNIINDLGPVTRRDEWWATDGPYEIIAKHLTPIDLLNQINANQAGS
jgi:hypothetical protein